MRTIASPQPVNLEVPQSSLYIPGEPHNISMRTAFFRLGSHIPEAIEASEPDGIEGYSIISAGSSSGAELDSVLALYQTSGGEGAVWARGFDAASKAVDAARRGRYTVNRILHPNAGPVLARLEELGFATEPPGIINSAPIREGHDVDFVHHDLVKPLPVTRLAHLILVNNLLYHPHLDAPKDEWVVRNLSEVLAAGGVMSFDDDTMMLGFHLTERLTALMTGELDMEPLSPSRGEQPTMFRKAA